MSPSDPAHDVPPRFVHPDFREGAPRFVYPEFFEGPSQFVCPEFAEGHEQFLGSWVTEDSSNQAGSPTQAESQQTPSLNRRLRVADILRRHGPAYVEKYGQRVVLAQRRVLADLTACRTRAMGSYADRCNYCGSSFFGGFNSCRNRHCPTCGGPTRARWLDQVRQFLLPVPYFLLTFTVPDSLSTIILANRRPLYHLLFQSAWETIRGLVAQSKRFGGETGAILVLHTWNQRLGHHPHIHAVVPAGALSPEGCWRASRPDYFLPVEVLSWAFKGAFLDGLQSLRDGGKLQLNGQLAPLANSHQFKIWLMTPLHERNWVVHVQPAPTDCQGPDAVLKYLARYVAGTAISDERLISHDGQRVTFWVKDRERQTRFPGELDGLEFTRRFLMHVLPKGFQRVRYRGLFHSARRNRVLPQIREQLAAQAKHGEAAPEQPPPENRSPEPADTAPQPLNCPACGRGQLKKIISRDTPENWIQVLDRSPFQLPWSQWDQLDRADWMPVLQDDPPAPLRCLSQMYLPLVYHDRPADEAPTSVHCRGQPLTQSSPKAA